MAADRFESVESGAPPARALMPDYLRLVALFGIVVVNVQFIGFSALQDLVEPMGATLADALVLWLVNGLALLKTYGLFSFMFGVGLGYLMRSAARKGVSFNKVYRNRMLGLCGLGLLHGCLFFPGDILVVYSVAGSVLYLWRGWRPRRLVIVGAALLVGQVFLALPMVLLPSDMPPEFLKVEREALGTGSFGDAVAFRSIGFAFTLPFTLLFQGLAALGWFCLGLAAVTAGLIDNPAHPLWRRARRWCLGPGVLASLLGAGLWQAGLGPVGPVITIIVAPVATLGYLGLIAWVSRPRGPVMSAFLAAGGSSLSIYLGQSIILSSIFSGYGLGLWGALDRVTATVVAILVTALLIVALALWRRWCRHGPFEWILRRVTYAGHRS